jgi:hypothetical protein
MKVIIEQKFNKINECTECDFWYGGLNRSDCFCKMGYWSGNACWNDELKIRVRPQVCRDVHGD